MHTVLFDPVAREVKGITAYNLRHQAGGTKNGSNGANAETILVINGLGVIQEHLTSEIIIKHVNLPWEDGSMIGN